MKIRNSLESLRADEGGATLVEYGLLLSLIAIACIVALTALSTAIKTAFTRIGNDL